METKTKRSSYPLVMTAVMAAVISAVAPFALPIGPIPITLGTLVMYLAVCAGRKAGRSCGTGVCVAGSDRSTCF